MPFWEWHQLFVMKEGRKEAQWEYVKNKLRGLGVMDGGLDAVFAAGG